MTLAYKTLKYALRSCFLGAGLGMLIGCQNPRQKGQWYHSSPKKAEELGVIVEGLDPQQVDNLVAANQIGARPLSKFAGSFEIYGLSLNEIEKLFPGKKHSENQFIETKDINPPPNNRVKPIDYPIVKALPSPLPQLQITNVYEAWKKTKGEGATVAVIDTGLSWRHEDFDLQKDRTEFSEGWNFGDGNTNLVDPTGHGTAVAGIIASSRVGIAPEAQIIPLKVINSTYKIDEASVIAAIRYSLEHHIGLIHFSLGRPSVSDVFLSLVKEIEYQGALLVAAAGNQGSACDSFKQFPAGITSQSILSIGATLLDINDPFKYSSYSNFGSCVNLAAPGGIADNGLWAPIWQNSQSNYRMVYGTSMAAPMATGIAALAKSLNPTWTGSQIREFLINSSLKSPELEGYVANQGLIHFTDLPANSLSPLLNH